MVFCETQLLQFDGFWTRYKILEEEEEDALYFLLLDGRGWKNSICASVWRALLHGALAYFSSVILPVVRLFSV